jgi:CheY-like chemotaxis protein
VATDNAALLRVPLAHSPDALPPIDLKVPPHTRGALREHMRPLASAAGTGSDSEPPGRGRALRLQGERGERAIATMFLPVLLGAANALALGAAPAAQLTILVVDDEDAVRTVTARMLQHSGYDALTAADGPSAVALLRRHGAAIDCVLLDMTMPHMGGAQTMRALHELRPDLRVLLMSGYSEAEALHDLGDQRSAGFLHKPFTPATLRAALHAILAE